MTTEACTRSGVSLEPASSIYRHCPFLPRVGVLSLSLSLRPTRRFSYLPSRVPSRWFQKSHRGKGCPRGFCPSFVSPSNYDLPHDYEPYVNIYPFHRFPFSFPRLFSLFLSLPRYRAADVILCSVGLQMHPRWRPRTPRMTDELQRRSFYLIGVYRTFQLRGERRGVSLVPSLPLPFSLSLFLGLYLQSLVLLSDIPPRFFLASFLDCTCDQVRDGAQSMTHVKESRNESGVARGKEIEREGEGNLLLCPGARAAPSEQYAVAARNEKVDARARLGNWIKLIVHASAARRKSPRIRKKRRRRVSQRGWVISPGLILYISFFFSLGRVHSARSRDAIMRPNVKRSY